MAWLPACDGHGAATAPSPTSAAGTTVATSTTPTTLRPAITSIDDCSPVPQGVGTPQPSATERLGDVVVFVEEGVAPGDQARVAEGIRAAQRYVQERLGGFRFEEPICVDVRAGSAGPITVGVIYGANHIVLYTGARPLTSGPPWLLAHVSAHEFLHFWQKDVGAPRDAVGPTWLLEGSAELLGSQALDAAGVATTDDMRSFSLLGVGPNAPPLSAMERRGDDFSYPLAFFACELLTRGRGPGAFRDYWSALARGTAWEAAFALAFSERPDEFYARFEEHRQQGFPR